MCTANFSKERNTLFFIPIEHYRHKISQVKIVVLLLLIVCLVGPKIYGQQLHTHSNAMSIVNESNTTSGWVGSATRTVQTVDPYHGAYAMEIISTSTTADGRRASYTFAATIGETYDISIWAKSGAQTTDPAFASWAGVSGFLDPTLISMDGTWAEYTFTVTATTTTPIIRVYTGTSSSTVGDSVFIDHVSITPHVPGGGTVWAESGSVASYMGEVAVGTSTVPSGYKLAVEGKIRAREIRVDQDTWPDYVFDKEYELLTLEEVQKHIEEKGHLPNIPSAQEVEKNGVELGEMDRLLLEKIEQLTLYVLEQQRQLETQKVQLSQLKMQLEGKEKVE